MKNCVPSLHVWSNVCLLKFVMYIHTYLPHVIPTQTGAFLGYNITHSDLFDFEDEDLGHKSLAEMKKMVSLQLYLSYVIYM